MYYIRATPKIRKSYFSRASTSRILLWPLYSIYVICIFYRYASLVWDWINLHRKRIKKYTTIILGKQDKKKIKTGIYPWDEFPIVSGKWRQGSVAGLGLTRVYTRILAVKFTVNGLYTCLSFFFKNILFEGTKCVNQTHVYYIYKYVYDTRPHNDWYAVCVYNHPTKIYIHT